MVFMHMCEKLYDLDAKLQIVPQLAAALPTVSTDKLTFTIKLRAGHQVQRRHAVRRRRRQEVARPAPHAQGLGARERALAVTSVDVPGTEHGRAPPDDAVLAADGAARRPRRDDHVAEGSSTTLGDKFATNPVCVGPFRFKEPGRRRPHHARQVAVLLRHGARCTLDTDHLQDHHRPERARPEPPRAATSRSLDRLAVDRRCRRSQKRHEPRRVIKATVDRLPGDHDQHREQERARQAVRERRHAAREVASTCAQAFELALDRNGDQQGRLRRHAACPTATRSRRSAPVRDDEGPQVQPGARTSPTAKSSSRRPGSPTPVKVTLMIGTDPVAARLGQVIQAMAKAVGFDVELAADRVRRPRSTGRTRATSTRSRSAGRAASTRTATSTSSSTRKGSQNDAGFVERRARQAPQQRAQGRRRDKRAQQLYTAAMQIIHRQRPLIYLYHPVNRLRRRARRSAACRSTATA